MWVRLGRADLRGDLFDEVARFCEETLPENSIYGFLARERDRLFPDELFADLFTGTGRRSVPPSVVATVMTLQRLDGLSDREAVDRYAFDARWRYAAGVGGYGGAGWPRFAHTVLVDMRERLRKSTRADRIFEVALEAAHAPPTAPGSSRSGSVRRGSSPGARPQAPTAAGGMFSKDRFEVDLEAQTATCPAGVSAPIRPARSGDGSGVAYFGPACAGCPLRAQCTTAKAGRTIAVGAHEQALADARARQADPTWVADYRATRPKVERKLGHLMRRRHGGRRARVGGTDRVDTDFRFLAGAVNLARLATLRVRGTASGWVVTA